MLLFLFLGALHFCLSMESWNVEEQWMNISKFKYIDKDKNKEKMEKKKEGISAVEIFSLTHKIIGYFDSK